MISWIEDGLGMWTTPDPEEEILMVGHVIRDQKTWVLIDPPVIPGLPRYLSSMGTIQAIILTTHDHTRGSRYLSDAFSCPIYAPRFANHERLEQGRVEQPEWYDDSARLPGNLVAHRIRVTVEENPYMDEMACRGRGPYL